MQNREREYGTERLRRSMFTKPLPWALPLLFAAALAGCSSVFSGSISGTVYDATTYGTDEQETVDSIEVYLYQEEDARSSDREALQAGDEATGFYDTTASAGDGTFTLNFVWNTFFPEYGDTGDREEVFLLFFDPSGEYRPAERTAVVLNQFTSNVVGRLSPAEARAEVSGTVEDAVSGGGLGNVTVSGYLPLKWSYPNSGSDVTVDEWSGGERAFRVTTGADGGYQTSFTFPKELDGDESGGEAGDERVRLRLVFSRTGYVVSPDGDADLSDGTASGQEVDVDGDDNNDVYYESPVVVEGVTTSMDTIGLKPTEFTVTLEGKVFDDSDTDFTAGGEVEKTGDPPDDTPVNGKRVTLTVSYPEGGDDANANVTETYETTTQRSGAGEDAEDGTFTIDRIDWKDQQYDGKQSTVTATITVEGAGTIHLPEDADGDDQGELELISGTENYVEVLFEAP